MSNERLIARGRLEELKSSNYALLVEIRTLADDIKRKIPTPETNCTDTSNIKSKDAKILIERLIIIQDEFTQAHNLIAKINKEYNFKD